MKFYTLHIVNHLCNLSSNWMRRYPCSLCQLAMAWNNHYVQPNVQNIYSCIDIYSAKKVLHNWGLWQFISNTGSTRLHDLYHHFVPSLRDILFETESKSHEKSLRNMCLMVPGVGIKNDKMTDFIMLYSVSDSARDNLVNPASRITSRFLCKFCTNLTNV